MSDSAGNPPANVIYCGAGARWAAQIGAVGVLREAFNIQKNVAVSSGVFVACPVAAKVEQGTLEGLTPKFDMHALLRSPKPSPKNALLGRGLFSLDGPVAALRDALAEHGNGGTGVHTFRDLRPLDHDYASQLREHDRSRLIVRLWTLPEKAWLWPTIVRIAWADRRYGEAHSNDAEARRAGVFAELLTRHLPEDADGTLQRADLPVADVAALTLALPAMFGPGWFPKALGERTYDGAMLERVPVHRYPAPTTSERDGGNDLFRLDGGRRDRTPAFALAMEQPNGLTAEEQAAWDWEHKTKKHGIVVIRLPDLGVGLSDFRAGQRAAVALMAEGAKAADAMLHTERVQEYLTLAA